jgi:hypothetical protein
MLQSFFARSPGRGPRTDPDSLKGQATDTFSGDRATEDIAVVRRPMGDRAWGPGSAQLDMGSWPPNVTARDLMDGGQSLSPTGYLTTRLAHLLHWQLLRRLRRHRRPKTGPSVSLHDGGGRRASRVAVLLGLSVRPAVIHGGILNFRTVQPHSGILKEFIDWVPGEERYHTLSPRSGDILLSDFSTIHTPRS